MIILMGVAGAGKSLQGKLLADESGYAWISTGELFRVLVTGKRRQQMLAGKLLSDDEVIELIDKTLKQMVDTEQEFLLDGFPRTTVQADWLLEQIKKGRLKTPTIFNFVVTPEVVKDRLLKRGRQDDTEAAIQKRFHEYETITRPILDYFKEHGLEVHDIDADREPEVVHKDILKYLG